MPELPPLLVSRREGAQMLGVCQRTFDGLGLPVVKIGNRAMFAVDDLREFVRQAKDDGAETYRTRGNQVAK